MDNKSDYVVQSLEQHLFFSRFMKEHALFLKAGFLPPNANLARESERFLRQFDALLRRAVSLSNRVVRSCVLKSGELFTDFTERAERQTQRLTGTFIDRELTAREMQLRGRGCDDDFHPSHGLVRQVRQLNRDGLALVNGLIQFKTQLLRSLNACRLFTSNYPLLIEHILREARLYRANLMRLEGQRAPDYDELCDQERFWDRIMMEHALFIRGLLDPTEDTLIDTADGFAQDYRRLLDASRDATDRMIHNAGTLALTEKFRDFKCAGVKGIEACEIRSIILPLLADHVLREANHYLRLLKD